MKIPLYKKHRFILEIDQATLSYYHLHPSGEEMLETLIRDLGFNENMDKILAGGCSKVTLMHEVFAQS